MLATRHLPAWSDCLLMVGLATALVGVISPTITKRVTLQRRIYWSAWGLAVPLLAASGWHRGPTGAVLAAFACGFIATLYAFVFTPYLKISGRIHSWSIERSRPDPPADGSAPPPPPPAPRDSYLGHVTSANLWWTLTSLAVLVGAAAIGLGWSAPVIAGGALISAMLGCLGHLDGRESFGVARRQHIPLAITAVASVPLFLIPVSFYFAAYRLTDRSAL